MVPVIGLLVAPGNLRRASSRLKQRSV